MNKFLMMVVAALLAFVSHAGADDELWLYWMIDASGETGGEQAERIEFYGANLYVVEESGTGRLVDADFGTGTKIANGPVTVLSAANELTQVMQGCGCLASDISGIGVGASFYVELLNANGEAIGRSQEITMDALIAGYDALTGMVSGYQTQDPFQHGHGGQWVANSFYAVPEPSSGLLLLIGTALLALRRRRA